MKQLIVLAAILPLMLIFMAQYTLDQKNSATISILEQVYTAKEKAKQEGCFTEEIKRIKGKHQQAFDIDKEEINIDATESRQYRINYFDPSRKRGIIHYSVSVPIKR